MKKFMILAASAAMLIGATACSEKNNSAPVGQNEKLVYTGVLPAADVEGIRYTLTLDYDQDDNNMKGDFDLVETYFSTDSVAPMGVKDFL
ncbi:MAG: copper resistance protein NlpE N-terminal domain-containing protein, partial [Muribaculaceae bacterium]|nr:copper resistance protein NlpE N-terminal domain-containing protein [Muribaculaceae bacterium]